MMADEYGDVDVTPLTKGEWDAYAKAIDIDPATGETLPEPRYERVGWMTPKGIGTAHSNSDHEFDKADQRTYCSDGVCIPLYRKVV